MLGDWQWRVLTLPPRHFSWRVRGNALYWHVAERGALEDSYDLLLATSMVDLATLRGLVPSLASVPAALYFHENQFAYPHRGHPGGLLEAQLVSLYGGLAADRLLFNSQYNLSTFLDGCTALLARLPDCIPPGLVQMLHAKAGVLPVPLPVREIAQAVPAWPGDDGALRLLWSGRFEHDRGADLLLEIAQRLEELQVDYRLALTGPVFRQQPAAFRALRERIPRRIVHCGYIESVPAYHGLLRGAEMVLSTTLHEFQGVAVLEAVAAGALPVVPDRLVYPELYPAQFRYAVSDDHDAATAAAAVERILELRQARRTGAVRAPDVEGFSLEVLAQRYRAELTGLALGH